MSLDLVLDALACPFCAAGGLEVIGTRARAELRCPVCGRTTRWHDGIWHAMGDHRPPLTPAQITNVFPTPWFYDRVWRPGASARFSGGTVSLAAEMDELTAATDPGPGTVFVDVGCSEGRYARALAERGAAVLAVEHSLPFLQRLARTAQARSLPIVPVRALAQHLPIRPGGVGGAVLGGTLNEIGDIEAAVTELGRVVAPGGRVFSMSLTRAATLPGRLLQRLIRPNGIVFPTEDWTVDAWRAGGFEITDVRRDGVLLRVSGRRAD